MKSLIILLLLCLAQPTLGRFIPFQYGLIIEILLLIIAVSSFKANPNRSRQKNKPDLFLIFMSIWFIYILMQFFNPESASEMAWLYAFRGISIYGFFIGLTIHNMELERASVLSFFKLVLGFSVVAGLYSLKQNTLGLFTFEYNWLYNSHAHLQHVLWGKLRVFSLFADASICGNFLAHSFVLAFVLGFGPFSRKTKIFLSLTAVFSLIGLSLSGTRGAFAVPLAGVTLFALINKNSFFRIAIIGGLILAFSFLKFTSIGHNIYAIHRMRTGLDPNDPSLHTRIFNRAELTKYLKDKPFGGGIGSAGSWGKRFSPHTWLANFETDGGYTRIRAECGIIGRNLYVLIHLLLLLRGARLLIKMDEGKTYYFGASILSGYAGILASNYGNSTLDTIPINIICFTGMAIIEKMHNGLSMDNETYDEADSSLEIER